MRPECTRHPLLRERPAAALWLLALLTLGAAGVVTSARADDGDGGEFATAPLVERSPARDLREVLALADEALPLRVTLASRDQVVGHPWRVYGDTLLLVPPTAWRAGRESPPADLRGVPLADLVRVEQSRSGARAGAGWGAKSGALIVCGLGLLTGAAVSVFSDSESDLAPIVAFGAMGAAAGALTGAGIGAGVGALGREWIQLWPADSAGGVLPDDAVTGAGSRRARLAVEAAWSFDDGAEQDGRGPGVRVGVVRRFGDHLELGPFAEYHDLRGLYRYENSYDPYPPAGGHLALRSRMFALGLDVRLHRRGPGLRPFGTVGIGWCLGDDLYLGLNGGGGLRWRGGDNVFTLVVRRHHEATGTEPREGRFWSIAAGVTFGD